MTTTTELVLDDSKVPPVLRAVDVIAAYWAQHRDQLPAADPLAVAHSTVWALTAAGYTIGATP